jgi:hypothetical protein
LNETQSKDTVYSTRAAGALPLIDQYADQLTSFPQRAANLDPTGVVRGRVQTPEFQMAQQAGDEFLQAILRKDTGAAITTQEQELYGVTYLPQPGDSPLVLKQKAASRRRAVEAINAGLPPLAIVQAEKALLETAKAVDPAQYEQARQSYIAAEGTDEGFDEAFADYLRENGLQQGAHGGIPAGIDPSDWEFMTEEERALFQ